MGSSMPIMCWGWRILFTLIECPQLSSLKLNKSFPIIFAVIFYCTELLFTELPLKVLGSKKISILQLMVTATVTSHDTQLYP